MKTGGIAAELMSLIIENCFDDLDSQPVRLSSQDIPTPYNGNLENLTIWNRTLEKAENSINHVNKNNVKAKEFDIDLIFKEVNPGDIVISQLPATRHPEIAKLCLEHKCHFASTSYLNPEILALHEDVKQQNLVFINEIGLDPGIDHFFSHLLMKIVKQLSHH